MDNELLRTMQHETDAFLARLQDIADEHDAGFLCGDAIAVMMFAVAIKYGHAESDNDVLHILDTVRRELEIQGYPTEPADGSGRDDNAPLAHAYERTFAWLDGVLQLFQAAGETIAAGDVLLMAMTAILSRGGTLPMPRDLKALRQAATEMHEDYEVQELHSSFDDVIKGLTFNPGTGEVT